jgi:murein DD-endopeptidase MepM/ murein hydrolase activator NlpD
MSDAVAMDKRKRSIEKTMRRKRYYTSARRGKKRGGYLWFFLLVLISGVGAGYIYLSPKFEREPPSVSLKKSYFSNAGSPIEIDLRDNQGLGSYQVILSDGVRRIVVASGSFPASPRQSRISVLLPEKSGLDPEKSPWKLTVTVTDRSLWNLGKGNAVSCSASVMVDTRPPMVGIVASSPSIVRGGSALVIFQARDKHLAEVYVRVDGYRFKAIPYRKKGYWAALIAWPFRQKKFRAVAVAVDHSGNKKSVEIPIEKIEKKYRISRIRLSDRFLDGKIAELAAENPKVSNVKDRLKRFVAVNEGMREDNEKLIHKYARQVSSVDFGHWSPHAFYPLKSAKRVADFGDERHYYYQDKSREISLSYHLGYDLASVRRAPIVSSNDGVVVFAAYNGIYGNMPLIDHGFGLFTLYGHCSSVSVSAGEKVKAGEMIAKTGKSGLALGDHLHFGILVQGIEVLPMDWMKQNWINSHITGVMRRADKVIHMK